MGVLDDYSKALILIKENPIIIILIVLLTVFNIVVSQGIFNGLLLHMETFSYLSYLGIFALILLILVDIFICTAVIGITRKLLLNERVTLKIGWEIGKKYFLKVLLLNMTIIVIITLITLIFAIISALIVTIHYLTISDKLSSSLTMVCIIIGFYSIFTSPAVIIGEKGVFKAIKQSIQLANQNKIKTLILLILITLTSLISFIPIIGSILSGVIGTIVGIYLLIVITLIYLDLT